MVSAYKKLIIFMLLFIFPLLMKGQQFIERSFPKYYNTSFHSAERGPGNTLYLSFSAFCYKEVMWVNQKGGVIENRFSGAGFDKYFILDRALIDGTRDSSLVISAIARQSFDNGKNFYAISKINSDTTAWFTILKKPFNGGPEEMVDVIQLDDTTVVGATLANLYKVSPQGDSLWRQSIPSQGITQLTQFQGGEFIAVEDEWLFQMSELGFKEDSVQLNDTIQELQKLHNNYFVVATSNHLIALDSTLSIIKQTNSGFGAISIYDTLIAGRSGGYNFTIYDTSLSLLYDHSQVTTIPTKDIVLTENNVFFGGTDENPKKLHKRPYIKSFSYSGLDASYHHDIGVQDVRFSNKRIENASGGPPGQVTYNVTYACSVTVQNYGNDTIDQLWLNGDLPIPSNCAELTSNYDSLNLMPGDTSNFFFSDVTFYYLDDDSTTLSFCVNTSGPENWLDANKKNDNSCIDHQYTNVARRLKSQDITVYPTPFDDYLNIDMPEEFASPNRDATLQIYDMQGKQVRTQKVDNGYIDQLGDLPKGVLLLEVTNDDQQLTRKIVHQ